MTRAKTHKNRTRLILGDSLLELQKLPDQSIQSCVTSPPYFGLRDYGMEAQIGLEESPQEYIQKIVTLFREVHRVLADDGTLWLNLGDSYGGASYNNRGGFQKLSDPEKGQAPKAAFFPRKARAAKGTRAKNLMGIPWRVAFALQEDGWILRQDIIWHKPNPMPESVRDRCTKSHEYIFLLSKSPKYYFDHEAIKEPSVSRESIQGRRPRRPDKFVGRRFSETRRGLHKIPENKRYPLRHKRSVWSVTTKPFRGAHFAVFPPDLIEPCIKAGSPEGGTVLDPFMGAGTTGLVANRLGRGFVGIELNPEYLEMARERMKEDGEGAG